MKRARGEPGRPTSLQHEISVYQEELIIQNEALITAQAALEETRDRFIELYDFAPTGYLTLDQNGVVRECNLTASSMLGRSKSALEGSTLFGLVHVEDQPSLLRFLRRCRSGREQTVEATFRMRTADGPRYMDFRCRVRGGGATPYELFASIVDVTERRHMESERERMAEEHAALAGRLLTAQEDERRRIARNVHDDLGQQATALRLMLEQLAADPTGHIGPRLRQLQQSLARLDQSLHQIAAGLRPAALELGMAPAVRQLVNDWSTSSGIAASLEAEDVDTGSLTLNAATHLFRILQEALTNVAKHAGARRVCVVLKRTSTSVLLVVEDDGRGFDVDTVRSANQALGLIGMRERVQLLGGRLDIKRGPRHGTVVSVMIPATGGPQPPP